MTLDDVCVCGAQTSLDVVWADVSFMCINVDMRARGETKQKCVYSVLVGAWFMSVDFLSRSFQIVLSGGVCVLLLNLLCFYEKIHRFLRVR